MQQAALWIGPALCALAVLAGAFGAHALKARLTAESLALWETAARYLIYAGFGLTLVGLLSRQASRPGLDLAAGGLLLGGAIFCGTVAALALGGPRWLGAVTPAGGLLLILGFVLFAVSAYRLP